MGRGRQKAKATKQARDMKYFSPSTDYSALEKELAGGSVQSAAGENSGVNLHEDPDYADYADKYADLYPDDDEEKDRRKTG